MRRAVHRDQRRDVQRRVPRPAGLHVLVSLEAAAAGQLEIDLVLEEHGRLAEQLSAGALQLRPVARRRKPS